MAKSGSNSWRGKRVSADLSSLPYTLDASPSRIIPAFQTIFGAIWTGSVLLGASEIAGLGPAGLAGVSFFLLVGVGILVSGLFRLTLRRSATFRGDGVEVVARRLLGSGSWYLPYTAFKGVLYREEVAEGEHRTTIYQIIELVHEEPGKCILLYVEPAGEVPRARWEAYARQLGLPALEADRSESSGMAARDHGDLDKPLRELVKDGRLGHAFDRDSAPPSGLRVTRDGPNSFAVTILAPRTPIWFLGLFMLTGMAIVAGALFTVMPVIFAVVGLILVGGAGYALYRDRTSNRQLRLDRGSLALNDDFMFGHNTCKALFFDEIESIAIRREASGGTGDELVISGDNARMHVGFGLSREALTWLKNFLTAAIATA